MTTAAADGNVGDMANARGCDVSHWNPPRDWVALRRAVDFVGIKSSQGDGNTDPALAADVAGARGAEFEFVWYYHVVAPGDPRGQAKRMIDLLAPLLPNERLTADTERSSSVPFTFLDAFFDQLFLEMPDRDHCLYSSNGYWVGQQYPDTWEFAQHVPIFLPRYKSGAQQPVVPKPWTAISRTWAMWQQAQDGHLPGIDGNVDLDEWNGDVGALRTFVELPPT